MIKYFVDGQPRYLVGKTSYTEEEWNKIQEETRKKDFLSGYNDRKAHCYDKWYRYNRSDEGKAYDEGVQKCVNEAHSKKWMEEDENFHIIECVEAKLVNAPEGIKAEFYIDRNKVN